ncbi:hypothetical protein PENSPDRAFT_595721, partial [Peniophora sp. CONT]
VSVHVARAIMLAHIKTFSPEVLTATAKDGSRFSCSDAYVRKFLYTHLRWVPRKSTRAAQKTPVNADEVLWELFLLLALTLRDSGIHDPSLFINFDQTQVVVADTSRNTFDVEGSKQVGVVGKEEKRAWTSVVAVAANGEVLPTQVIMQGKTSRSLPASSAPRMDEAKELGFVFSNNPDTYWSNLPCMEVYFEEVVVPFFEKQKERLGLDSEQECVVLLDCWSVHRSAAFHDLVRTRWPWLCLRFVPGGMTGLAQPCDVGIQRVYKLSIKNSQLNDVVAETMEYLEEERDPALFLLDTRIAVLRDCSVSWLVQAWHTINQPELVKKVSICSTMSLSVLIDQWSGFRALHRPRWLQLVFRVADISGRPSHPT